MIDPIQTAPFDLDSFLNKSKGPREVTANLGSGTMSSFTKSEGDQKLFDETSKSLGKQDFLNLLVTQLRFQDPLNPTENTEFVAQLAQFSALEGTQNINASMEKLAGKLESMAKGHEQSAYLISQSSATSLIGKQVRVETDTVEWKNDGNAISVNVFAEAGYKSVLSVVNGAGTVINAIAIERPGDITLAWTGLKADGTVAAPGKYTLKVTTYDGSVDTGYTYMENVVNGISYAKDGVRLEVDGQKLPLDKIVRVGAPTE